jgi:hypothetical protein
MRIFVRLLVIVTISSLLGATLISAEAPLTNHDVVSLSNLGVGDPAVIAKVRQAPAVDFRLDVDGLAALKKAGVSGSVITAMLDRSAAAASPTSQASASSLKEPDYIGNFSWRNPTSGDLMPLERQTGSSAIDVKAMGFGGAESYIRVSGDRSPVRFKEGDTTDFVVLAASQSADPQALAQLFVLDAIEGDRRLPVARAASMGISGRSVTTESQIQLRAVRYGKSSFLVTPAEPLGPGEYAFAGPVAGVGFCFGVDANPGSGRSRFERVVPFKLHEVMALGISDRGMTVSSVEVIRWPKETALTQTTSKPDAKSEIVVKFTQTNKSGRDYKCAYDVVLLDESGAEIGTGKRKVGIEDGEADDTVRVGIPLRLADYSRVAKLRIRAVPEPDR